MTDFKLESRHYGLDIVKGTAQSGFTIRRGSGDEFVEVSLREQGKDPITFYVGRDGLDVLVEGLTTAQTLINEEDA